MRKIYLAAAAIFTALSIMANGLFPLRVSAVDIESGHCGENLVWSFSVDTLTITGTGEMTDYKYDEHSPWYEYRESITKIDLDEGITHIGNYAFHECFRFSTIRIPDSVKSIGDGAFYNSGFLQYIEFPESLEHIGVYAFADCYFLKEISIPKGVKEIDQGTFDDCWRLKSVTIPDGVISIGYWAFDNCKALERIDIPASVKTIGMGAFTRCSKLKWAAIPEGIEEIREFTFENCYALESVTIPDSVKKISLAAFEDCQSLETVIVPENVEAIGLFAFENCKNAVIYYPTAAEVNERSFEDTKAVARYEVRSGKAYITEITGDTSGVVFPKKISGHDIVYEDVSSGACVYEICELI